MYTDLYNLHFFTFLNKCLNLQNYQNNEVKCK